MSAKRTLSVLTGIATIMLSGAALAANPSIDFNVPVDVKTYPVPNDHLAVWCEVLTAQRQVVAGNYAVAVALDGSGNSVPGGVVRVKVFIPPDKAAVVKDYRCALIPAKGLPETKGSGLSSQLSGNGAIPRSATILHEVAGQVVQ